MKITSLYIENFGTLHGYSLTPNGNLNVICEHNGFGKTTLAAFLRAMLYGFEGGRKSLDENDRKKYLPWQGGAYGGTMTFWANGKHYRLERFFGTVSSGKDDTFTLYDLATNTRTSDFSENIGIELFGIDSDGFARSAFLSQKLFSSKPSATAADNVSLTTRLGNLADVDDDPGAFDRALGALDKKRQYYRRHGGHGEIADIEAQLLKAEEKEAACIRAGELRDADMEALRKIDAALSENTAARHALDAEKEALSKAETQESHIAHGKTLYAEYERRRRAIGEALRFLSGKTGELPDDETFDYALSDMKAHRTEYLILTSRIAESQRERDDALAQLRAANAVTLPSKEVLSAIKEAEERVRHARAALSVSFDDGHTALSQESGADCLSDGEFDRHMQQAAVHASALATLAEAPTAQKQRLQLYGELGIAPDTPHPTEHRMDLYASDLRALSAVRLQKEQLTERYTEAKAELDAFCEAHTNLPSEEALVSLRTKFDALTEESKEIEVLNEKQRATASAYRKSTAKKRRFILLGVFLCVVAAVLFGISLRLPKEGLPIIAATSALIGVILFLSGIFARFDPESRILDDNFAKVLCEKKTAFEMEKSAISDFLCTYLPEGAPYEIDDFAATDAALVSLSTLCRKRETLSGDLEALSQSLDSLVHDVETLRLSLSEMREDGEVLGGDEAAGVVAIRSETEDEAEFATYRNTVRRCITADQAAKQEAQARELHRSRADALAHALRAYLAELESSPAAPYHTPSPEDATFLARLASWKTAADTWRLRQRANADAKTAQTDAEDKLSALLEAPLALLNYEYDRLASEENTDPLIKAKWLYESVSSHRIRTKNLEEAVAATAARLDAEREAQNAHRIAMDLYLSRYFDAPYPDDDEAVRRISEAHRTLESERQALQRAEAVLHDFLNANALTEEALFAEQTADTVSETRQRLAQRLAHLREQETQLQNERARIRLSAETHSANAAKITAVREEIANLKAALCHAEHTYDIILKTQAFLKEAKTAMSTRYLGVMQTYFETYFSRLASTDTSLAGCTPTLDATLTPYLSIGGVLREESYFSRGTVDLIALCVRLALIEALYTDKNGGDTGELPPLIFDDPFVNLDTAHLARARTLLEEVAGRYQILYFVCHESRA